MKLLLPATQLNRMVQIMDRVKILYESDVELFKCMLLRQFLLFAMKPKSYTVTLYKKYRVRDNGQQDRTIILDTKLVDDLNEELDKARSRQGTKVSEITENIVRWDYLVSKMLIEEINALYKSEPGKRKYTKKQFASMHDKNYNPDPEIKSSIIEYARKNCECSPQLKKLMEKYDIQLEYMIYYILLSANFPRDKEDQAIMQPTYIKRLVDMKLEALKLYIDEAEKMVNQRDTLDIMYSEQFDNANILAWRIRAYMRNGGEDIVGNVTKPELRKEIVEMWKEMS